MQMKELPLFLHPAGKCMLIVKLHKCQLSDLTGLVIKLVNTRCQIRKTAGEGRLEERVLAADRGRSDS